MPRRAPILSLPQTPREAYLVREAIATAYRDASERLAGLIANLATFPIRRRYGESRATVQDLSAALVGPLIDRVAEETAKDCAFLARSMISPLHSELVISTAVLERKPPSRIKVSPSPSTVPGARRGRNLRLNHVLWSVPIVETVLPQSRILHPRRVWAKLPRF